MLFFRQLVHLLPRAIAWQLTVDKSLRRLFEGLASASANLRDFVDLTWLDAFPETTRELDRWEAQFGLQPAAGATESARRLGYAAAWAAQGGQSPRYLQDVVQAAGFPLFVHEWWVPGSDPPVARDPHPYTEQPKIGTVQCGRPFANCTATEQAPPLVLPGPLFDLYPQCNRFLVNETHYLVNLNLTRDAPPPVPDDEDAFPYFLYFGGEVFGTVVEIPAARREELERLLLKLRPMQNWIVTMIDYV
jgi:hypothetical protein